MSQRCTVLFCEDMTSWRRPQFVYCLNVRREGGLKSLIFRTVNTESLHQPHKKHLQNAAAPWIQAVTAAHSGQTWKTLRAVSYMTRSATLELNWISKHGAASPASALTYDANVSTASSQLSNDEELSIVVILLFCNLCYWLHSWQLQVNRTKSSIYLM